MTLSNHGLNNHDVDLKTLGEFDIGNELMQKKFQKARVMLKKSVLKVTEEILSKVVDSTYLEVYQVSGL
jgi:hypothetical protein